MRKIKVVEMYGVYSDEDIIYKAANVTEWEEVDEDTFAALKYWAMNSRNIMVLEEKKPDIPKIVADYIDTARKMKQRADEAILKQKKKEDKKRETIEKRKKEKERALLESLKKKYPE